MTELLIKFIRKIFDSSGGHLENYEEQVSRICGFESDARKNWNFIIDSLYLIEDVQLSKQNFSRFGLEGPTKYGDQGEQYLRLYGIYNACYLEKQAIFKIMKLLKLPVDERSIDRLDLFQFRKWFASHTVTVGRKTEEHSYILDRYSLSTGTIEGYSSNTNSGHKAVKGNISKQIDEWNLILDMKLFEICEFLFQRLKLEIGRKSSRFERAFNRIKKIRTGNFMIVGNDIWSDKAILIQLVGKK